MMEKIGVFYGSSTGNCETVAVMLKKALMDYEVDIHDILSTDSSKILDYDKLIFGVSTWGIGGLQDDWLDFVKVFDTIELDEKVVAMYGLGDQDTYSDSFVDGLGIIYTIVKTKRCKLIGTWPNFGYTFEKSKALVKDKFVGLVIDEDNQPELTEERIAQWTEQIRTEFAQLNN